MLNGFFSQSIKRIPGADANNAFNRQLDDLHRWCCVDFFGGFHVVFSSRVYC